MKNEKEKKSASNNALKAFVWLTAFFCISVSVLYAWWTFVTSPVQKNEAEEVTKEITVPAGMSVREVSDLLEQNGLIKSAGVFYYTARFSLFSREKPFTLKSGTYTIKNTMPLKEIYNVIQEGTPSYISVSIPEGLTVKKTAALLEERGVCPAKDFIAASKNKDLIKKYSIPAMSLEGFLFPDTYFFAPGTDAVTAAETLVSTFFQKAGEIDGYSGRTPSDYYHTVILASIIEREYRVKEEAPLISSVFTNRIKTRIGLYSCATIEYIITELEGLPHPGRITAKDLKIDSPYNTYMWAGLPPAPISNPGKIALDAAMHPADTNYFFFVLNDPVKGTHTFSESFDEHKAAQNIRSYASKGNR